MSVLDAYALDALLLIPAIAVPVLALVSDYRLGSIINVIACALTFGAGVALLFAARERGDLLIVDDFNIFFIVLTTFVGSTTAIFSATYIAHEIEIGRITPTFLRFYHAMFQAMMGAMNVALVANNIGLMWVGVEVATLSTVMMVGIYRTPEAIEAAWKYFILGSVGIGLAFFGTILIYLTAQEVLGEGVAAMSWDLLAKEAARFDPRMMSLAFVFLLVGYGTKVGLAPFHAWLPDAHAEGPTPISAVLSGLLLNVALYALLRFKMVLAANPATLNVGAIMMALGLISLIFAAFMLYRRRDIKRLFAYSSIEHMGIAAFAFGIGGPLANFAGLLHMTMHSLTKSAIFFAVGHATQSAGTQVMDDIRGLLKLSPTVGWGLMIGTLAILGMPPFGVFASEFLILTTAMRDHAWATPILLLALGIAFAAIFGRVQSMVFGETELRKLPHSPALIPVFAHLAVVLTLGVYIPPALAQWYRLAAALIG